MIKKLTYETDKCLMDCDGLVIPSHNVRVLYNSENARPFIYFRPNANNDGPEDGIVIVGENGSTHRNLVNMHLMEIKGKYQIKNEKELLRGRLWYNVNDFGEVITLWDKEYIGPITSDLMRRVKNSMYEIEGIDIGDMWLSFLCEGSDYYMEQVDDYIFGGYSDKTDLIQALAKQEKIMKSGSGHSDKYSAWDYNNQGVGYLGYHLMTRQDESKNSKVLFSKSDIKQMVLECVRRILTTNHNP